MLADLLEGTKAVAIFSFYLLAPGYVIGWAGNLIGFRGRTASERLLLSVVLSIATAPLLAVLIGRFISPAATQWTFLGFTLVALLLAIFEVAEHRSVPKLKLRRSTWVVLGIGFVWLFVALFELADLQLGNRLYLSVTVFDHCIRASLVQSAVRTGVPPLNPLSFVSGQAPVLRYYYYWYVLCAMPAQLSGLPARACFSASSVWCGLALIALIPLYLKHFFKETDDLRRKSVIGVALLAVTGLDLIPTALWAVQTNSFVLPDMDWWNPTQVTSWVGAVLWVPHHVAALIACLVGFLLLSCINDKAKLHERFAVAIVAGVCFASATGLSVYVTFTFAIFVVLWTIVLLPRMQFLSFVTFAVSGVIALVLSRPFLHDLQGSSSSGEGFALFALRDFPTAVVWLKHHNVTDPFWATLSAIPTIPVVYAVEFGFFMMVGALQFKSELLRAERPAVNRCAAWGILCTSLFVTTFVRSGVITTNDLGIRAALLGQFVLLLWAAPLLSDMFGSDASGRARHGLILKRVIAALLVLGVMGSVYQLGMLRVYAPLVDSGKLSRTEGFLPPLPSMGQRTYGLRAGFEDLDGIISKKAVIQYNPMPSSYPASLLYSNHQTVAGDSGCGASFGGDPQLCQTVLRPLDALFNAPYLAANWDLDDFCNVFSVDVLVVTDADRAWYDTSDWVWNRRAIVANNYLRAIPCGTKTIAGR
jgi:hypothetical protein